MRYREDAIEEYARAKDADGTVSSRDLAVALAMNERALIESSLNGAFVRGVRDGRSRRYRISHVLQFLTGA